MLTALDLEAISRFLTLGFWSLPCLLAAPKRDYIGKTMGLGSIQLFAFGNRNKRKAHRK